MAETDSKNVADITDIEGLHKIVTDALNENIYRTHIGRFQVKNATGRFSIGTRYKIPLDGKLVVVDPAEIESYDLRLDLQSEEIPPGAIKGVRDVNINYHYFNLGPDLHERATTISMKYDPGRAEVFRGYSSDTFGFDLLRQKNYIPGNPQVRELQDGKWVHVTRGMMTPDTISWVLDQLKAEVKVPA